MKREFYVDTPLGKLHIHAKYDTDNAADYPGVYVDLVRDGHEDEMLACVEFDSYEGDLLTTAYDAGDDQPKCYYHHQAGLGEDEDDQ